MRPGPARRLTQDEILDAAFALLAERGSAALSLRGVASAVGVAPTALYTYFPSKDALMSGMVERVLEQVEDAPPAEGATASERLHAVALTVYRGVSARPGAASLLISGPLDGPAALAVGERLIHGFVDAGLGEAEAARASYTLQVYVLGSAILASVGAAAGATHSTSLPSEVAAEYPLTLATAAISAQYDSAQQFEWGLSRVLEGLFTPMMRPAPRAPGPSGS